MRSHSLKCGLVIGFLAAGLLAAAAASAAEGPEKPGIDFIYPKGFEGISLAVQDAPTPAAKASRLSVKLYGGYSHVLAGDVNEGSDYYFEILEPTRPRVSGPSRAPTSPSTAATTSGATSSTSSAPSSASASASATCGTRAARSGPFPSGEGDAVTLTAAPTLTAMPIRLGLFFTTPLSAKLNLTADAGAAYYAGLKLEATQGLEFSPDEWMEMTVEGSERSGIDIGFQGSLGVEYMLSPKLGLFFEAVGRYAKFSNFEVVTGTAEETAAVRRPTEGKLYLASDDFGTYEISGFTIVETGDTRIPSSMSRRSTSAASASRSGSASGSDLTRPRELLVAARRALSSIAGGLCLESRIRLGGLETLRSGSGAQTVIRGRETEICGAGRPQLDSRGQVEGIKTAQTVLFRQVAG